MELFCQPWQIVDGLLATLAAHVDVDDPALDGTRAVEPVGDGEVLERLRLHVDEHLLGARTLELEDAVGVGSPEERVGGLVVERQGVDVDVHAALRPDEVDGLLDDGQVGEAEKVHLEQADLLHAVHVELGDDRVAVGRGALQRHDVGQRLGSDDHPGGVGRGVAADALEALGVVDDLLGPRLAVVGHQLGEAIDVGQRHVEDASHVADGGARRHGAEGDDLGDALAAVLLLHVGDDPIAAAVVEVAVDVGHGDALAVEEALEEQVVAQRVEVGDLQHVGDQRPRGAAATWTDLDAVAARRAHEVPDDEEVGREAGLLDDVQLHAQPLVRLARRIGAEALAQALLAEMAQVGGRVHALGDRLIARQQRLSARRCTACWPLLRDTRRSACASPRRR